MTPTKLLKTMLADPRTRKPALVAAQAWSRHQDLQRLDEDLAFIAAHIAEPEPEPVDHSRREQVLKRIEGLLAQDRRLSDVLADVARAADDADFDAAERSLSMIEDELKSLQQGSDTPLPVRWRGEYQPGVMYSPGDLVNINGGAYVATVRTSSKPLPVSDSWDLVLGVVSGPMGPPGPEGSPGSPAASGYGN